MPSYRIGCLFTGLGAFLQDWLLFVKDYPKIKVWTIFYEVVCLFVTSGIHTIQYLLFNGDKLYQWLYTEWGCIVISCFRLKLPPRIRDQTSMYNHFGILKKQNYIRFLHYVLHSCGACRGKGGLFWIFGSISHIS